MKKQARHRETNITIRLQWNPKAQRMPPQNYASDFFVVGQNSRASKQKDFFKCSRR